jgi:hypothetical protein
MFHTHHVGGSTPSSPTIERLIMKSGYWYVAILIVGMTIAISILLFVIKQPSTPVPCQDAAELRRGSDTVFKCHPKASLYIKYGEGIPSDHILVTCQCRQ